MTRRSPLSISPILTKLCCAWLSSCSARLDSPLCLSLLSPLFCLTRTHSSSLRPTNVIMSWVFRKQRKILFSSVRSSAGKNNNYNSEQIINWFHWLELDRPALMKDPFLLTTGTVWTLIAAQRLDQSATSSSQSWGFIGKLSGVEIDFLKLQWSQFYFLKLSLFEPSAPLNRILRGLRWVFCYRIRRVGLWS